MKALTATVVGGPFAQNVDAVLRLVPTGDGLMAARIAKALEKYFVLTRIGNFPGGESCSFHELKEKMEQLRTDVVVFMPHLPNILIEAKPGKISIAGGGGSIAYTRAPKIVEMIKEAHPEVLLVPFKLAASRESPEDIRLEVVRWMLNLHSALAVYSVLGESGQYHIVDALGNENPVSGKELPEALAKTIVNFSRAERRRSERVGTDMPEVKYVNELVWFSRTMQPAFEQIIAGHVVKERWPGNFSFRCTHGFLSARQESGFLVTIRNVAKTGLTAEDFVFVALELDEHGRIAYRSTRDDVKPSIDSPVHRIIYRELSWVQGIVHGHLKIAGDYVHSAMLRRWPCGAENEGQDVIAVAPKRRRKLWAVNITGHGFIALIGDENPREALEIISKSTFATNT